MPEGYVYLGCSPVKIHLAFSFSLGLYYIKWPHTDSRGHYHFVVILKRKGKSNCLFTLLFMLRILTGWMNLFVHFYLFHSRLPASPAFPKVNCCLQNESQPLSSVLHCKKSFSIQCYYLTRKPHPQKMQMIRLAVIL